MSSPKIASTMLGTPAIISTADSTARASHEGRRYSDSQAAIATPIGAAIRIPIAVTISVPIDRVAESRRSGSGAATAPGTSRTGSGAGRRCP